MASHGDDAAAEAAREQSALVDYDAERRGDALAELDRLGAPLRPDATWDDMAASLARDVGVAVGAINFIDHTGNQSLVGVWPLNFGRRIEWPDGFCPHAMAAIGRGAYEVHGATADPAHATNTIARQGRYDCYMAERIMYDGVPIGTVSVVDRTDHRWSDAQRERLAQAAADALNRLTNFTP